MLSYLDDMCYDLMTIGDNVTISYGVYFACHGHGQRHYPITIGDNAYIGMRASIISKKSQDPEGGGLSDSPKGRKQSIREHRQCLREEFGMKYYLYMLHPTVMYTSLKHRVSTVSFLFPFYRKVATIVGSIKDKRRGIKK